jgi:predicted ATPase
LITAAHIQHYKSVADVHLPLRNINVIVGPNGSGKSNILDALYFLHDCISNDIDTTITRRHGVDSLRQWSKTRPYDITIGLHLENEQGKGEYKVIISSNRGNFRVKEESGNWLGPPPPGLRGPPSAGQVPVYSSFLRRESGDVGYYTNNKHSPERPKEERPRKMSPDELCLQYAGSRFVNLAMLYFRPIFNEVASFAKYNIFPNILRSPQLISKETKLDEDGSNLSSILKRINSDKRYAENKQDIIDSIKIIISNIVDIQIKSAAGFYVPVVRVEEPGGELHDFNLSQISDGTLRTLSLLTAFYQPAAPSKIGIEEPELMIHPGALQVIKDAMETYVTSGSTRRTQVFVTTHSPALIDLFAPEDIIWARFKNGTTIAGNIGKRQMDVVKKHLFSVGELVIAEGLS